jgi:hypothetical protein
VERYSSEVRTNDYQTSDLRCAITLIGIASATEFIDIDFANKRKFPFLVPIDRIFSILQTTFKQRMLQISEVSISDRIWLFDFLGDAQQWLPLLAINASAVLES